MKIVLQRVSRASVTVDNNVVGSIDRGYVVLLGVGAGDDKEVLFWIGYVYRYWHLLTGESSREIYDQSAAQ